MSRLDILLQFTSRMLLSLMLMTAWSGAHLVRAQDAARAGRSGDPTEQQLRELADRLERLLDALDLAHRDIPRETFDPEAIIALVGRDPQRLYEWVRDQTHWVPYQGSLRGATGVLMDRLGNSLDRSLLLGELLRLAGYEVRLARGELTEAQAAGLLERLRPVPQDWLEAVHQPVDEDTDRVVESYAARIGVDAEALRLHMQRSEIEAARLAEEAAQRVAEQAPMLAEMVGIPDEREDPRPKMIESLREHWWVERRSADGWVSADLFSVEESLGPVEAVEAVETVSLDRNNGTIPLGDEWVHHVVVRVVIEQWKTGELNEATVLEHVLRPAELFGARISLSHVPLDWPREMNLFAEQEAVEKLKEAALAQKEWLPVLEVGNRRISQFSFTDAGEVNENPSLEPAAEVAGRTRGLMGGMGGALGGGAPPPAEAARSHLTAQWIEYEIRVPGEGTELVRRQVFDLLASGKRATGVEDLQLSRGQSLERGLSLLGGREMLVQVCQFSPQFIAEVARDHLKEVAAYLNGVVEAATRQDVAALDESAGRALPQQGRLYGLAAGRLATSGRDGVYLNRPNVLSFGTFAASEAAGEELWQIGFDIVSAPVDVLSSRDVDPFIVRMAQGVMDSTLESLLMQRDASLAGGGGMINTSELFGRADVSPEGWMLIRDDETGVLSQTDLPADARRRIADDVSRGHVVVAPRRAVEVDGRQQIGWWRVDPATGRTLGLVQWGAGGSLTEISLLQGILGLGMFAHGSSRCITVGSGASALCCLAMLGLTVAMTIGLGIYLLKAHVAVIFIVDVSLFFMLPSANDLC